MQYTLAIDEALSLKMRKSMITAEDIHRVVDHCESTGQKLLDADTGRLIGHMKKGPVTYWAVYTADGEGRFTLVDAYSHRMAIKKE